MCITKPTVAIIAASLALFSAGPVSAEDDGRVYLGVGVDNVLGNQGFNNSFYGVAEVASRITNEEFGMRWRAAADISETGYWGGAGLSFEAGFGESPFYSEISFLAGLYTDSGNLDLNHAIEFRSQVMFGMHIDEVHDVAVGYAHKSNAGLADDNPGTDSIYVRFGKAF